jgi:hypothetical protein
MSEILVITGLPRSGTSLMMQIIDRSGIPVMSDGKREKDVSNPEGYFELEAVKGIVRDNSFLDEAVGKAIKIVAPLPMFMNLKHNYRAIFMRREMDEILRSQEVMLNKDQSAEREKFRGIYETHLAKTHKFFEDNNIPYLEVNYNALMRDPETEISKLIEFCGIETDLNELAGVVRPELYRNRK